MRVKSNQRSSSQNALVHGVYAKDLLLPWDSKAEFLKLHQDLKAEFSPHGRAEDEAVLDLAMLYWQKRTVWRIWPTTVLSDPLTAEIVQTGQTSWSKIRKRLRAAASDERNLRVMLETTSVKMLSRVRRLQKKLAAASDEQEIKLLEEKLNALHRTMGEHLMPLVQAVTQAPNGDQAFDDIYAVEGIEKFMRLEAAIDARIAKVMARLVGLKEYKRTPAAGGPAILVDGAHP